ncbi:Histone deacetylase 6 [Schistosoma japonicum]|nr:Histone deacetylase 6 [Schistosoma japonicum]
MSMNTPDSVLSNTSRSKNRNKTPLGDKDIPILFSLSDSKHDHYEKQFSRNKRTAFVYDERMLLHKNIWFPDFVECPERFSTTLDKCMAYGLLSRCLLINPEPVNEELLSLYHQTEYIELINRTTTMTDSELKELSATLDSVYFNKDTSLSARLSVGSWIQAVDLVHRGDVRNAFCLVRPPGHHALSNEACGFCIYNNIVIAANYAIEQLNYNRILIVDWDVHHGNATQYAFYDNPNLRESNYDFIGIGRGRGFNVNIPLNDFSPELILISAGYDSSFGCPVGQLNLSPSLYAHLTHKLMALAEGKVIVGLEGGYYLDTLSESVCHTLSALLGDPMPSLDPMQPINPRSDVKVPNFEPTDKHHSPEEKLIIDKKFEYLKSTHPIAVTVNPDAYVDFLFSSLPFTTTLNNLTDGTISAFELSSYKQATLLQARYATRAELLRVHTEDYVNTIASTVSMEQTALNDYGSTEDSVYFNSHTYDNALLASGSLLAVIDEVCSGGSVNGMALIRPPGHHALSDRCMGFCFFNNVAIGARHAQQVYGLERIAIIDWDVHHGNGTAKIFEDDPNILYISVHRFDNGRYFPNSNFSSGEFCGIDDGLGRTVHIAWNGRDVKDGEYIVVFTNIIIPILYEFRPQLIIVSAGFDAAHGDKLGRLGVSPECFSHLTHLLMTVAHLNPSVYTLNHRKESQNLLSTPTTNTTTEIRQTRHRLHQEKSTSYSGGLVLALEGGYQLTALSSCVSHCVATLLGDSCPRLAPNLSISESRNTRQNPQTTNTSTSNIDNNNNNTTVEQYENESVQLKLENLCLNDTFISKCISTPIDNDLDNEFSQLLKTKLILNTNSSLTTNINDRSSSSSISKYVPESQQNIDYEFADHNASTAVKTLETADLGESYHQQQQQQASTSNSNPIVEDIHDFFGLPNSHEVTSNVFAVTPLSWCPHLTSVQNSPTSWKPDINALCNCCDHHSENWVCLSCYAVYCGRYANSHMIEHFSLTNHPIVLSYADLSTWCYECESYVHNEVLLNVKCAVYEAKFGEEMPNSS